ncbi:exosome complex exonuclease Rrp41 [Candidatus Heimdallarchaeota archaeon]|nr:MAG: exosome complex exonuclease Rrp41 [Candidatus Heimdallarchaeota archaeon]
MAGDGTVKLIDEKGIRLDGRKKDELRPTEIKIGVIENADGSAEIRMGKNIIIAAVYGPRELHPKHRAQPDRAIVQCFYRMSTFSVNDRKSPAPSRREKEISMIISEALTSVVLTEKYPRTTVDVYIQVLQADGGTRCASLAAASVALADAGVPMRGIIAAVASGLVNDTVVLDLYDLEDQKGSGDMPLGYCPTLNEVSLLQLDGIFTIDQFDECLDLSIEGAKNLHKIQTEALKQKYADIRAEVLEDEDLKPEEEVTEESAKTEPKEEPKAEPKEEPKDEPKKELKEEAQEKVGDE